MGVKRGKGHPGAGASYASLFEIGAIARVSLTACSVHVA